ncbi:hypothetical protein H4R35_005607 [Dimargaris xerosporica]|nr:hypothetical protein H4R35_005607 [Dimargaris xerosporica]
MRPTSDTGRLKPIILIPDGNVVYVKPKQSRLQWLRPQTKWARIALWMVLVLGVTAIALEALLWVSHASQVRAVKATAELFSSDFVAHLTNSRPIMVYYVLFFAGMVFLMGGWWNALLHKNIYQVFALGLFTDLLLGYAIVQFFEDPWLVPRDVRRIMATGKVNYVLNGRSFHFALISLLAFTSIVVWGLCWPLYREFAWAFFKRLGADRQMRRMHNHHEVLLTFFKLDAFFFLMYACQLTALVLFVQEWETWVRLAVAVPLSILIVALGFMGLIWENRPLLGLFMAGVVVGIGYMTFELVNMFLVYGEPGDIYLYCRRFFVFFSVINFLLGLVSIAGAVRCYRNFGQGLKELRDRASVIGDPTDTRVLSFGEDKSMSSATSKRELSLH